jgi:hypothetical protein
MSDYCVKISVKSDNHALHNFSSNPTDKVSEFDNNLNLFNKFKLENAILKKKTLADKFLRVNRSKNQTKLKC